MSDFILPEDIQAMANQVSQDIADAWDMLTKMCIIKQFPLEMAEDKVLRYVKVAYLSELEAIRKVYHEVAYS